MLRKQEKWYKNVEAIARTSKLTPVFNMRYTKIIILTLLAKSSLSQENSKLETDTSIIETVIQKESNTCTVFNKLKNGNKTYYSEYYLDTKSIKEQGVFFEERSSGIWKEYSKEGKLQRDINHDKGVINYFDKMIYPYYDLQNKMKTYADKLVSKMYGNDFLNKNTVWSIDGSYIYNDNESGNWTDKLINKPTKFLFRYNIKLDEEHKYNDLIEFELDDKANFLPDASEEIYGFEDVPDKLKGSFRLNYSDALQKARSLGLTENDSTKAFAYFHWESFKRLNIINGQFRFYLAIITNTIETLIPNGRSSRVRKYDVYSFNPWTGDFIEKKKMKSVYSWEQMSGSGTGLIPDNE